MAIKTINQLMKSSVFVSIDGTIEHSDAFVEMLAYYFATKKYIAKNDEEKKVCDRAITKLRFMVKDCGYNYAEVSKEAHELVERTMIRAEAKSLLKAA